MQKRTYALCVATLQQVVRIVTTFFFLNCLTLEMRESHLCVTHSPNWPARHFCNSSTCQPLNEWHSCSVSVRHLVLASPTDSVRAFAWFYSFSPSECRRNTMKQAYVPPPLPLYPVQFTAFIRPMFCARYT